MAIRSKIKIGGRNFYYYNTYSTLTQVRGLKKRFPKTRYYYVKGYNPRTKQLVYHAYLDVYMK